MNEAAFVFDLIGDVIAWHCPANATPGAIPDSSSLWSMIWDNRTTIGGIAHLHPWEGIAQASPTDLSTFRAIETGIGRELVWPVVTLTDVQFYERYQSGRQFAICYPRVALVLSLQSSFAQLRAGGPKEGR